MAGTEPGWLWRHRKWSAPAPGRFAQRRPLPDSPFSRHLRRGPVPLHQQQPLYGVAWLSTSSREPDHDRLSLGYGGGPLSSSDALALRQMPQLENTFRKYRPRQIATGSILLFFIFG